MEGYWSQPRDLRLAIQLVDMRHPATEDDIDMVSYLGSRGTPFAVALTKADKLKVGERARMLAVHEELFEGCGAVAMIQFSATTGEGADMLRELIEGRVES